MAVEIEQVRPRAVVDKQRLTADGPKGAGRAVNAAWDYPAGTLEGLPATGAGG
jgi:hypothetical protein